MNIIRMIRIKITSSFKLAVKEGMTVGKNVTVMGRCNFGSEPYLITIGDNVRISFGVSFVTHDGATWTFRDIEKYNDVIKYGKIFVGSRTFIGCNSTILPGVRIGERCIIGAGSVVTKDIPDGCVVCGVPARVIMTTIEYAEKCLKQQKEYNKERYNKNKKIYLQEWLK